MHVRPFFRATNWNKNNSSNNKRMRVGYSPSKIYKRGEKIINEMKKKIYIYMTLFPELSMLLVVYAVCVKYTA